MIRIVLHGVLPAVFHDGLAELLGGEADIRVVPHEMISDSDRRSYVMADVIISVYFSAAMPRPARLKLLHLPNAGTDGIDFSAVPPDAIVCNSFGHEQGIAEYVMAALLMRHIPLAAADRHLKLGDWTYRADPAAAPPREELAGKTIGLLGFGHIGKAIASRAKAFEMSVNVANRTPVSDLPCVDRYFDLGNLEEFWGSADFLVFSLPLLPGTQGIVDARAFAAMRPGAIVVNVGRGMTVDEQAFFDALQSKQIAGAVIDTWYDYPTAESPRCFPSSLPFHELPNVVMTPHMAAWTQGTLRRRRDLMADNIRRRMSGQPCINVVWPCQGASAQGR